MHPRPCRGILFDHTLLVGCGDIRVSVLLALPFNLQIVPSTRSLPLAKRRNAAG
jgi:hypothetical protein